MVKINVHAAKTQLSKLLERAHRGEELVICKDGEPYARLVPLAKQEPRKPGWLGKFVVGPEFDLPLPKGWTGEE
jgi:prevent-host-death family protein